jgi:hypothetical protein
MLPMTDFFADRRPHNGLSYEQYRADWKEQKDRSTTGDMDKEERKQLHYLKYNWDRQAHVHDAYEPSEALRSAVATLQEPQLWMVLTEPWCGDSAFLLPVVAEAAALSDSVTLRILLRDDNLDVMDHYLTDGSRSIPKLVVFSEDGDEQFAWGPRPAGAAERFAELRDTDLPKEKMVQKLIAYYEDGGFREADAELAAALRTTKEAAA